LQLQELQEIFSEEEIQEMQQYQYDELGIDNAISRVKEINADIERLKDLFNKKVEQLKSELDYKIEKLEKKKQWDLWNLQNAVKNAPDKRETKTQWKKQFLSGDVIVRKAREKMIKPKVDEEIIKEKFDDYKKEKIEPTSLAMKSYHITKVRVR